MKLLANAPSRSSELKMRWWNTVRSPDFGELGIWEREFFFACGNLNSISERVAVLWLLEYFESQRDRLRMTVWCPGP